MALSFGKIILVTYVLGKPGEAVMIVFSPRRCCPLKPCVLVECWLVFNIFMNATCTFIQRQHHQKSLTGFIFYLNRVPFCYLFFYWRFPAAVLTLNACLLDLNEAIPETELLDNSIQKGRAQLSVKSRRQRPSRSRYRDSVSSTEGDDSLERKVR